MTLKILIFTDTTLKIRIRSIRIENLCWTKKQNLHYLNIIKPCWPIFRVVNVLNAFFWLIPVWLSDWFFSKARNCLKNCQMENLRKLFFALLMFKWVHVQVKQLLPNLTYAWYSNSKSHFLKIDQPAFIVAFHPDKIPIFTY